MCETQQEIEIIQKALNKVSKMENKTAAAPVGGGGAASSTRQAGSGQPRKAMRRGFFMTLLQQKANQVLIGVH